jgi:phosphoadenosine phosphosulfate reductase
MSAQSVQEPSAKYITPEQRNPALDAEVLLDWACKSFGEDIILTSSFGAESALMLHLVTRVMPRVKVVFIDTGYLFPETYRFVNQLKERFDLNLKTYSPNITSAALEATYGRPWEGTPEELDQYLKITKVEPMERALRELRPRAWLAGVRATQTEFRSTMKKVEVRDSICKISPILDWTEKDIASYMQEHSLPYHPLVAQGYRSIGDAHSTRPTTSGNPREGRRLGSHNECGTHLIK